MSKLRTFPDKPTQDDLMQMREYARSCVLEGASLRDLKKFYSKFLQYWAEFPIGNGDETKHWEICNRRIEVLLQRKSTPNPWWIVVASGLLSFIVSVSAFYIRDHILANNNITPMMLEPHLEQSCK